MCAAVNFDFIFCNSSFDFILFYNLLLCFMQLEMHVRLICGIKFYLLTYTAVIALHRIVLAEADPAHHPSLLLPVRGDGRRAEVLGPKGR